MDAENIIRAINHPVRCATGEPPRTSSASSAKWDRRFDGEVHTHYEDDRWFGTRLKHRMKSNWLKIYDKFGVILRVETVINSPKEFWVYRTPVPSRRSSSAGYFPMTKNVASLVNFQAQALACNRRYLDALAVVDDRRRPTRNCVNSPSPKWSTAAVTPASVRRSAKTCDSSMRLSMATTSGVAFATATSGNHCSGASRSGVPATACQRGGGATAETTPRASSGGEDPDAHGAGG